MPVARIADGRESVYAHAAGIGPGRWRITWDTGRSVETDADARRDRRDDVTLRVDDLGALRRASLTQSPEHHEHGGEGHQGQQQGAGHASTIRRARSAKKSGGAR